MDVNIPTSKLIGLFDLHDELLGHIVSRLDHTSFLSASFVSRSWRRALFRTVTELTPRELPQNTTIPSLFPNVLSFSFLHCIGSKVGNADVIRSLSHLTGLTYLSLRGCNRLTGDALLPLQNLTHLEVLDLTGCKLLRCDSLAPIQLLSRLHSCIIDKCEGLRDEALHHLSSLSNLQRLSLGGCTGMRGVSGLAALNLLPKLEYLNMSGIPELSDDQLSYLSEMPALQELNLDRCPLINCSGLVHLQFISTLATLSLMECSALHDISLEYISGSLTSLKRLTLDYCRNITDGGVASLAKVPLLQLSLRGCDAIRGIGFSTYSSSPLQVLNLEECTSINAAGLRAIAGQLVYLKKLSLKRCGVSDRGADALAAIVQLECLKVSSSAELTSEGICAIAAGCLSLKHLDISSCPNVGNAGVAAAARLPCLRSLSLCGCGKITDEGVMTLICATQLVDLNLAHTMVETIGPLVESLGNLRQLNVFGCEQLKRAAGCTGATPSPECVQALALERLAIRS